jgi:hypothetical protein
MHRSYANCRVGLGACIASAAVLVCLVLAGTASAVSAPIQIANTGGEGVLIRAEPNTSSTRLGWMPEGASPDYNCFVWGQDINGVPIWFNVNYSGITGYYASYYDNSSYKSNEELTTEYGVPLCGAATPSPVPVQPSSEPAPEASPTPPSSSGNGDTPPSTGSSGPTIANAFYNREASVQWALANARNPQARLAMCAWFVSHALWAGGFPQQPGVWDENGHYSFSASGTADEWLVPNLLGYLEAHYSVTYSDISSDLTSNAVPQAEVGDLIFYDWEKHKGEGVSHVAIVVGIASGDYPEVSEMGQFDFGLVDDVANKIVHVSSPYSQRGWTWSALHHKWLQKEYRNMKAYLLHINGGYIASTF